LRRPGRQQAVGQGRPPGDRPGAVGHAVQPEEHRLHVEARGQLRLQLPVLLPRRPGLGPVAQPAIPEGAELPVVPATGSSTRARSPWALAWRRLRRNRTAMVSLVGFIVIVVLCLAAPIYAHDIAHTDPFTSNVSGTTIVNGKEVPVLQQGGGALGIG